MIEAVWGWARFGRHWLAGHRMALQGGNEAAVVQCDTCRGESWSWWR